ncbi:MAG TPA: HNH endonuclease signature motif containing protein [Pseudodesulfovibrio sp.]|nr:HNH endonuclease signature motif containing protein [Pseudodesulfovibrio sp.]
MIDERIVAALRSHVTEELHRADLGPCWVWTGCLCRNGYGQIHLANPRRKELTHRLAWETINGHPGTLHVCHKCDVPACCNPSHMFLGTPSDNLADMRSKGRSNRPRGEDIHCSKMSEEDVIAMRESYAKGETITVLSARYGVCFRTAKHTICGEYWTHVPGAVPLHNKR